MFVIAMSNLPSEIETSISQYVTAHSTKTENEQLITISSNNFIRLERTKSKPHTTTWFGKLSWYFFIASESNII